MGTVWSQLSKMGGMIIENVSTLLEYASAFLIQFGPQKSSVQRVIHLLNRF